MSTRPSQGPEPREEQDEDDDLRDRPNKRPGVSDFVRRAIENTVGSVQSNVLSKEAVQYLLQQGDKGRKEVLRIIAHEVGEFLRHTDLSSEIVKILTGVEVDLNMNIKFRRAEGGKKAEPEIDLKLSTKDNNLPTEESVRKSDPPPPPPPESGASG